MTRRAFNSAGMDTPSGPSPLRDRQPTVLPRRASSKAMTAPMPRLAPVTRMFWAVISGVLEYGFSFLDQGCQTLSGINGPIGNRRKVGFDLAALVQRKIQGALDGRVGQTESK